MENTGYGSVQLLSFLALFLLNALENSLILVPLVSEARNPIGYVLGQIQLFPLGLQILLSDLEHPRVVFKMLTTLLTPLVGNALSSAQAQVHLYMILLVPLLALVDVLPDELLSPPNAELLLLRQFDLVRHLGSTLHAVSSRLALPHC